MSFDPGKDFAPVALIASVPIVLAVHPDVKAKTVGELVALAKAAPGTMNFGSSGNGSTNHLAGELFKARAGIDIVHIPYRGAAPAMNDLIAGHITGFRAWREDLARLLEGLGDFLAGLRCDLAAAGGAVSWLTGRSA